MSFVAWIVFEQQGNVKYLRLVLDRQRDRRTPVKQYAPNLLMQGHKKTFDGRRKCSSQVFLPWQYLRWLKKYFIDFKYLVHLEEVWH